MYSMRYLTVFLLLYSLSAHSEKLVDPGDTAYWSVHCNGNPVEATYIDRPYAKENENLSLKKHVCYFIKKDYYTMKYGGFVPITHNDKLEFHLKKKRVIPGEYDVVFEAMYTPINKPKKCNTKIQLQKRKVIKKVLKINKTNDDHLIIFKLKDLDNFNNWYIQDLELKLTIKLNKKLIHKLDEKFLNWSKCNIYSKN